MPGFANSLEESSAQALTSATRNLTNVMYANSGSEAVHRACQLARKVTGKRVIVKLAGGYDGWLDGISFGTAGTVEAQAEPPGFDSRNDVALLKFNSFSDIDRLFATVPDVAAVIVEPVLANAGCVSPAPGYLAALADATKQHGALFIADEVLTGFRLHHGLASHFFGVSPDIALVGKAIGSGLPVAAVLLSDDVAAAAKSARFSYAGTYNGNPVVCAAVASTASELSKLDYAGVHAAGERLQAGIRNAASAAGCDVSVSGYGTVFTVWPSKNAPQNFADALGNANTRFSEALHQLMLDRNILTMREPFGRVFITQSHDDAIIDALIAGYQGSLAAYQPLSQ